MHTIVCERIEGGKTNMESKEWAMQENFIFSEGVGLPDKTQKVVVTPRFTEERTEDGLRLTGIYHIAANIDFVDGERAEGDYATAILIDDVELNDAEGYFEYAIPLHIDLPPEVGSPLQVQAIEPIAQTDGQGGLQILWDVKCSYEEIPLPEEKTVFVEDAYKEKEETEAHVDSTSNTTTVDSTSFTEEDEVLSFIAQLEDDVSTTAFHSNEVFVKNKS